MVLCVLAWSEGQMGRSVVNSNVFVMSKRRSGVNSNVFHVFAWSKRGNVVNSNVFVCFCMAERRTCRKVSCFCVFFLGRNWQMSKSVVFLHVFWVKVGCWRSLGSSTRVHNLLYDICVCVYICVYVRTYNTYLLPMCLTVCFGLQHQS